MSELPDAWKSPPKEPPRRYIGSGDIAAIVALYRPELAALAKWKSAADVWLRLVHGIDLKHKPSMSRGLREEEQLRQLYRDSVGPCGGAPGMLRHPRFEWAGGSPDGLAVDRVVELKTHSIFAMGQWGATSFDAPTDLVPEKYALQCIWLCGLAEMSLCDVLMGFGRDVDDADGRPMFAWSETRLYRIGFDEKLYRDMEQMAERFYLEHVVTKVPPDCLPVENKRDWKRIIASAKTESPAAATAQPSPQDP